VDECAPSAEVRTYVNVLVRTVCSIDWGVPVMSTVVQATGANGGRQGVVLLVSIRSTIIFNILFLECFSRSTYVCKSTYV
jgi:hypothetical protein